MKRINQLPLRQRGIALATSLVVLVMLTLLTMTAINTSTLEEKMAVSTQQEFLSFQQAESGLNRVFDITGALSPQNSMEWQDNIGNVTVLYQTIYRGSGPLGRGQGFGTTTKAYYYDVAVSARVGRSQSNVRAGVYQLGASL